ncbi:hypothetical protein [Paraburkholderia lacunae]|uniref:hypothetical protein n=1 Tax=Paraburkholderia lacunae TaxID=2211104 RepID=UPI001FCB1702|nr:hypothetical protein [Paraburkholderia lacunae]
MKKNIWQGCAVSWFKNTMINMQAALLSVRQQSRSISPFDALSEGRHFFRIITDYFFRAIDYFAAGSNVCAKRTGCRPSTDKNGDGHVRLLNLFKLTLLSESLHLPADLQSARADRAVHRFVPRADIQQSGDRDWR